ncbi:MAG: signal peptidase I [Candidatus Limnocylindria bacterium]
MSRRGADRPVRWVAHAFATFVALAVTTTIVALSFGLLAVRFVGLSAYVVMGGSLEPLAPIGSLVLVAPVSASAVRVGDLVTVTLPDGVLTHRVIAIEPGDSGDVFTLGDATASPEPVKVQPSPVVGKPWVAIPTLGYAVTYAEAYSPPIFMGLVIWILFVFAVRALAPHMSTGRRRLPA